MRYDPKKHHRRSIRMQKYDYSQPGGYFITICTQYRLLLFGEIKNDRMFLNDAGCMMYKIWQLLPHVFPNIQLDEFMVMPNHMHGVFFILDSEKPQDQETRANTRFAPTEETHEVPPQGTLPGTVGRIVQVFKSLSTDEYITGVRQYAWKPFPGKLWQRNYYEHVVRSEEELYNIRNYICNNPSAWLSDLDNPRRSKAPDPLAIQIEKKIGRIKRQ